MKILEKILLSVLIVIVSIITITIIAPELEINNVVNAVSVKINKTKVSIGIKQSYNLRISGTNNKAKWSTSNKKIAIVNSNGKVTGKKKGTAIITAKVGGKKYKCKVTVKNPALNTTSKTIYLGNTYNLSMDYTTKDVAWTSSNKNIVTVSKNGKVTGKKIGEAIITATVDGKKYTCNIKVKNILSVSNTQLTMKDIDKKTNVTVKFLGNGNVYWKIQDSSIAKCSWDTKWDGKNIKLFIEPLKVGTTTITITNSNNQEKVNINVTINPAIDILIQTVPISLSNYRYNGSIEQSAKITKLTYNIEKNSYNDNYKVTFLVEGEKTYDYNGLGQSRSYKIGYKLYKNGVVIKSSNTYTPATKVGEIFLEEFIIYDLSAGNYVLEILNVN